MRSVGLLLELLATAALVSSVVGSEGETSHPFPMSTMDDFVTLTPVPTPPSLPPILPPQDPPVYPPECKSLADKDRVGFDLVSVRTSVDDCPRECQNRSACATWTWNDYNGGTCWLKTRAGKLIDKLGVTATECVYNEYYTPMVCNAHTDIDFVGMDIGSRPGKTFGDCCDICNEFSGCTAYAWNNFNNGTCWLKKSVGRIESKPGVTSSSLLVQYGATCVREYFVDFVGQDIGNKPAKDANVCCGVCKTTPGCNAYTWSGHEGARAG